MVDAGERVINEYSLPAMHQRRAHSHRRTWQLQPQRVQLRHLQALARRKRCPRRSAAGQRLEDGAQQAVGGLGLPVGGGMCHH